MSQIAKPMLLVLFWSYAIFIAPISTWLLFKAQTWIGMLLALIGLLTILLPFLLFRWLQDRKQQKTFGQMSAFILLILVGMITAVLLASPSGKPNSNSPVQHQFFRDGEGYGRFALTSIIPESEQVNLGFSLMPLVDPFLTRKQANRVSIFTMDLYREMEQDTDFHELGSVMGLAYAELLGQPFDVGHYYLYIPQQDTTPLPAIVFLHGSAGNFKTYTWLWAKLAEAEGFVIIAPSYGFGNWDEAGVTSVLQAIEDAKQIVNNIDEDQIYLAGLSNGGLGVSQLAQTTPEMFQGLIFLSPVMDTNIVDSLSFQTEWANRPILVITGEDDKRIPISYVEQRTSLMEQRDIDVTKIIYPNEDHFLVFSQPENIMNDVSSWLKGAAHDD